MLHSIRFLLSYISACSIPGSICPGLSRSFSGLKKRRNQINNKTRKIFYASITSSSDPFTAPIFSSYIRDSIKPFTVVLRMSDLYSLNTFTSKIEQLLPINISYIVFIKLRYFNDSFCMSGKQFAFDYQSQFFLIK